MKHLLTQPSLHAFLVLATAYSHACVAQEDPFDVFVLSKRVAKLNEDTKKSNEEKGRPWRDSLSAINRVVDTPPKLNDSST